MLANWQRSVASRLGIVPQATPAAVLTRLRFVALLQGLGSLLGIYVCLGTWAVLMQLGDLIPISIFAYIIGQSVKLWWGDRRAIARLSWILLAQVPWINLHQHQVHYSVNNSLSCIVRVGNLNQPLELSLGTRFNAYFGVEADSAYFGINLVGLLMFGMLRATLSGRDASESRWPAARD